MSESLAPAAKPGQRLERHRNRFVPQNKSQSIRLESSTPGYPPETGQSPFRQ